VGIRTFEFKKDTLAREFIKLRTPYGEVTIKRSFLKGREVSAKPEYEECRLIATERNIPVKEVYNNIISLLNRSFVSLDDEGNRSDSADQEIERV
jgi:uncharacterized protein (DUF111 family)